LSELLRYALQDDGGHEVTFADELQFLAGYVEIQKVCFRERLEVRFEVSEEARRMKVPRMLLQPLVENAIQHGAPEEGPAIITVSGECVGSRLRLSVTDNGPGFRALVSSNGRVGIGLRNTSERLATLYRGRARVVTGRAEGGGASVVVEIPGGDS
jgi:two-component system LytT family sensor kinase